MKRVAKQTTLKNEIWKTIKDFSNYQVSNKGRIRSKKSWGYLVMLRYEAKSGYSYICLLKKGKSYTKKISRLVLETFIGDCSKNYQANHKDGNKGKDTTENLEWVTPSQNLSHAYEMGLTSIVGELHPHSKLKNGEIWLIKRLLWYDLTQEKIAKMFKVSRGAIAHINSKKTWSHIKFEPTDKDRELYRKQNAKS